MGTRQRAPFSGPLYGVYQLILLLSIVPGTSKTARFAALPILLSIAYYLITRTTTGDIAGDLGLGSAILTQLMTQLDNMFLTDPDTLVGDYDRQKQLKITKQPLKARISFASNLFVNPRGIGYLQKPQYSKGLSTSTPRSTFVRARLSKVVFYVLVECVTYALNASNPGMTNTKGLLSEASFLWRALGVACFGLAGYARIDALHCFLSALVVALGWSTPENWPNLFGSPLEAWSVQQFWGATWHQMLRKPLITHASFITTKLLRLPCPAHDKTLSRSFTSLQKIVWLCVLFFVVAVVHMSGEYMLCDQLYLSCTFKFFMLQPLGIVTEQLVVFLWTRFTEGTQEQNVTKIDGRTTPHCSEETKQALNGLGYPCLDQNLPENVAPGGLVRCVGYVWVMLWFTWTAAFMIDAVVPTGMFVDHRVDLRQRLTL